MIAMNFVKSIVVIRHMDLWARQKLGMWMEERVCNGASGQVNTPINVASLERLGIVVNNGGW